MEIPFTKMHGLGNDYVIIDERDESQIPDNNKSDFAKAVCDRGFSVGADGVLYLSTPEQTDLRMRIFNADGSEAESCGNGLRCAAFYHHGLNKPGESRFSIDLPLDGVVDAQVTYNRPPSATVRLTMGRAGQYEGKRTLELEDRTLHYHRVDVGNPHAVMFLEENPDLGDSLEDLDLRGMGPQIQKHPDFEDTGGINAEFVVPIDPGRVNMRVHERGVGETAACGTGCVAIARACAETGRGKGWVEVNQPGGALRIHTEEGYLQGPTEVSYRGHRWVDRSLLEDSV